MFYCFLIGFRRELQLKMENNQQSFWQFSDQLRLHTSNLANLSLNDSIWSTSLASKRPDERRNFDIRVGGDVNSVINYKSKESDFNNGFNDEWKIGSSGAAGRDLNGFNDGWKVGSSAKSYGLGPIGQVVGGVSQNNIGINGGFNKGTYSKNNHHNNINVHLKANKKKGEEDHGGKIGKKYTNKKNNGESNNNDGKDKQSAVDKRFKTLPPSESLARNETVGGYIFVCNNDTMQENLKRQLFGMSINF